MMTTTNGEPGELPQLETVVFQRVGVGTVQAVNEYDARHDVERLFEVAGLDPYSERIVRCRFGLGCEELTFAELGKERSVSREWVRQIFEDAIKTLRNAIDRTPPTSSVESNEERHARVRRKRAREREQRAIVRAAKEKQRRYDESLKVIEQFRLEAERLRLRDDKLAALRELRQRPRGAINRRVLDDREMSAVVAVLKSLR